MTQVVICTLGTRGDVLPVLALASRLRARNIDVCIQANANWESEARAIGADFVAIAPQDPPQDGRDDAEFHARHIVPSFARSFQDIQARINRHQHPVVIYKVGMAGAQAAAEKFALKRVRLALQPSALPSLERPSWPLSRLLEGRIGRLCGRGLLPLVHAAAQCMSGYRRRIDSFRREVGLSSLPIGIANSTSDEIVLLFCPAWFALPPLDWPARTVCVGFPFFDSAYTDPVLSEFLEREPRPVVFTQGTGVADCARFLEYADVACQRLGLPGVLLGANATSLSTASPRLLCRPFADLATLLPRATALVHHGGIGTTAQAIRAGIPQVLLPDRFDQPDNAMRVAAIRLGAAALGRAIDGEVLAALIRAAITDQLIARRLPIASASVRASDAAEHAAYRIAGLVTQPLRSALANVSSRTAQRA